MPPNLLTTAINALRYPSAANNGADFATGIANLAADIDPRLPALVTALPGSPVDKQEVYYQSVAMAAAGVAWHLRYRSGASGSYKWEYVGGAPWINEVSTQEATSSASFVDLATSGPTITAPLAGEYLIRTAAFIGGFSPESGYMSFAIGASAANDARAIGWSLWAINSVTPTAGSASASVAREQMATVASAASAITAKYKNPGGGGVSFASRSLSIIPVRVG